MTALILVVVGLPLAVALALALPGAGGRAARAAAPLAALPGLIPALGPGGEAEVGWLMLGARLGVDDAARVFLALGALTWTAAGIALAPMLRREGMRATRVWSLALVAMSGTLGAAVALDAVTFFGFFSTMTLAAYGVVVVVPTEGARRAGRVYLGMAVLGEAALLAGLAMAVEAAGSTELAAVRAALGAEGGGDLTLWLIITGFGVKAGALGLHIWMPLAYAAPPLPAAAALAGVVTEVGLLGWLRTLPLGAADRPVWGALMVAVGLAGAVYGVAVGVTQRGPGPLLAYSSVSQVGLMTAGVGAALADARLAGAAVAAVLLYLLHHGLVKAALFLGAGAVAGAASAAARRAAVALLAVAALALAGAPATSGGVAKEALKAPASAWQGWMEWALPVAAAGTAVLMGRLLMLTARLEPREVPARASMAGCAALLVAAAALVPLAPHTAAFGDVASPLPSPGGALDALWPIALAALILWAVWRRRAARRVARRLSVPPGDVAVGAEWLVSRVAAGWGRGTGATARAWGRWMDVAHRPHLAPASRALGAAEARITAWAAAVLLVVVVIVLLAVAL